MTSFRKPAEVYLDDGMVTAKHVCRHESCLVVFEEGPDLPTYYPWHRVKRVQRLPSEASQLRNGEPGEKQNGHDENGEEEVLAVEEWMHGLGIPTGEYDVNVHEEYGSINVSPDGQVDWWGDVTDELRDADNAWWDGDDRVWIIQDVGEVTA